MPKGYPLMFTEGKEFQETREAEKEKVKLEEIKMDKAIVFYCKDCGQMFFATMKNKKNIKNSKKEILQYLAEGHKIEEVDADVVSEKFAMCKC